MSTPPTSSEAPSPAAWKILVPAGLAEVVLLGALGWWPVATFPWVATLLFGLAFAIYAWTATQVLDRAGGGMVIWLVAIALRLVFLPLAPELSDEVYRYLWDGHLQMSGVNPFAHVPTDPAVAQFRTPWFHLLGSPDAHTVYPPLAQMAFLGIALVGGAVIQAKLLWIGLDLATGWLLAKVARFTGRSRRLTTLLYLWSPLLVVEVAWNGHMEPLGLFFLVLVILLARAPSGAGAAAALSALTKLAPLAAFPALTRRLGRRFAFWFAVVLVGLYAPYSGALGNLFSGVQQHVTRQRFMEGPFRLLEAVVPSQSASVVAAGVILLAVVAAVTAKRFRPERALFWILGAGILLTPGLRPWYVLWILPMAALRVSRPWILMSGLAFLGYAGLPAFQETGVWGEPLWARLLIWLPVLGLLIYEGAELWRTRVPAQPLSELGPPTD